MRYIDQSDIRWDWLHFDQLPSAILHRCMALRQKVFVLEQRCFYVDADDEDLKAFHLLAWQKDSEGLEHIVAYLRAYPAKDIWKIGRVLVDESERNKNFGKRLMAECHTRLITLGAVRVNLAAQLQVISFYEKLGYVCVGEVYQDAGIDHCDMQIELPSQSKPQKYSTIIFDFDGTLVDSAYDYAVSFQALATQWNIHGALPDPDKIKELMFAGVRPQLEYTLGPLNEEEYQKALEQFRIICLQTPLQHTTLYDGIRPVLDILKAGGYRLAICTNRPEDLCRQVLVELKLAHYFEIIIGGDRGYERKPSPEMLLAIFDRLEVSSNDCLLVGDSTVDVLSARAAQCDVLAVLWGYTPKTEWNSLLPLRLSSHPYELLGICT